MTSEPYVRGNPDVWRTWQAYLYPGTIRVWSFMDQLFLKGCALKTVVSE